VLVLLVFALTFIAPTVFLYFLVIKGTDRYEPEPFWLLTLTFLWGAVVATVTAIVGNAIGEGAVSAALGPGSDDALVRASTASFVAPLVEETTKGSGLLLLWLLSSVWLRELDGALDGAIYGGVIGLGFTLTEDVLYVASAGAQGGAQAFTGLFILRTVLSGLGHASFTAMTGLGVGIAAETSNTIVKLISPIGGWLSAVGLHFVHNFIVSFMFSGKEGLGIKLFVFWTFDLFFFALIVCLAVRDRAIVLRGLVDEVGRLLHPKELQRTTSYWMLVPFWNFFSLSAGKGYGASRQKQLALVELAFLKNRRRRGERGLDLDRAEHELRSQVHQYNQQSIFIGPR
jgi:protease PrsW